MTDDRGSMLGAADVAECNGSFPAAEAPGAWLSESERAPDAVECRNTRELVRDIGEKLTDLKTADSSQPRFILEWRLNPDKCGSSSDVVDGCGCA
jgi:hypothetical protein